MALVDGKRVKVVRFRGQDGMVVRWTDSCSGCTSSYEEAGTVLDKGMGCSECGHTGKRRNEEWVPLTKKGKVAMKAQRLQDRGVA
jgi:rRNA maturation endonuclease Nob1